MEGATRPPLDDRGDLLVDTAAGPLTQRRPVAYQQVRAHRQPVAADYVLGGSSEVGLRLGSYDAARALVIDPVLAYSTYLGGTDSDEGTDIAVDGAGAAYVTGTTDSLTFPTVPGAFDTTTTGGFLDAFVAKLNPAGSALVYSSYIGGPTSTWPMPSRGRHRGGVSDRLHRRRLSHHRRAFDTTYNGNFDAFVVKLNPAGSALAYPTYLGGTGFDRGNGIAVDGTGAPYVTGQVHPLSVDFPTTPGAFDTTPNGGGDAFVTKLNPAGSALAYSTHLGGPGTEEGRDIAVDGTGAAYVTVVTDSDAFPATPGAFDPTHNGGNDAFVARLNPAGSAPAYSLTWAGRARTQATASPWTAPEGRTSPGTPSPPTSPPPLGRSTRRTTATATHS